MKLFKRMKDGGPESRVDGYWLIESKSLFSIVLLHFADGSRDAYHSHAFNAVSWVLWGELIERRIVQPFRQLLSVFEPNIFPIITTRQNMHKVTSVGDSWVLSFRGPWANTWRELLPKAQKYITLTHGRQEVEQ